MKDEDKTKKQLIKELLEMRQQITELEKSEGEHRLTEEKLRESKQQYKRIFEFSPEVIGVIDTKGNLLDVNRRLYDWVGYKAEEVTGKNFLELPFLPKESQAIAMEKLSQSILGEDVHPYELDFITKSGEKRVGRILANPIRDENGELIGELVMASDVTEHKKMEEDLFESEEKYRTLVDNLNIGIYRNTPGPKGKFMEANPAIIKIFGYKSKEEFLKINVSDLYQNPKEREKFNKKILKDGFVRNEKLQLKKKDGTPIWGSVTAIAVYDENGEVKHYDGIIEDITERKQMEEALKESEEKYSNVVENANDAIYIITLEGFEYVNPAFEELTGYTSKEICSEKFNFWNIIHPDDIKLIKKREEARRGGKKIPSRYEFRIIAKDGKIKTVEPATVDLGKKGEIKVMGILRDITERKKAEEEMKRALEQEREFKRVTAHYFFNPLCIAKGYLELGKEKGKIRTIEAIETALHAIERIENVVKNVVEEGEIRE